MVNILWFWYVNQVLKLQNKYLFIYSLELLVPDYLSISCENIKNCLHKKCRIY